MNYCSQDSSEANHASKKCSLIKGSGHIITIL